MDKGMTPILSMTELVFYRGRVGLAAILKALKIGYGDDVAIQAFTCLAVPEAVLASGAKPVYVDISVDSFNMDADDLERKLLLQTRAIVVQHTFGIPADMDRIIPIAAAHGIPIIEDCCHTMASTYKGKTVGSFGVGSFYSFEWGKPVAVGIGGCVHINDKKLLEKVRVDYAGYQLPDLVAQTKIELQYQAFSLLYRPSLYWPIRVLFHWMEAVGLAESNFNTLEIIADDFSLRMAPAVKRRMLNKIKELAHITVSSQ
jgi:perosamine synthetase